MQRNQKFDSAHSATNSRNVRLPQAVAGRTIVLVGLMGAGKSTIGLRLANVIGRRFVDADDEIVRAADMDIAEMFERYGEEDFRDGERRVIARLLDSDPIVLATGGGAFIDEDTRKLIAEKGLSIWLDADIDVLAERVSRRDNRPLLRGRDPEQALKEIAEVRLPIYATANLRVATNIAPHERAVDDILEELSRWSG